MHEKKIEGLLLQAIPYLENQKILKVLTPQEGLLTLMAKKRALGPFTHPFLIAEWVYRRGKGEIHSLIDATLLNDLSDLRNNYTTLTTAGLLAQDLLKTQWPEKPGHGPYLLATAFLQKLFLNPETLLASFRLKLLLHDGHIGEQTLPFSQEEQKIVDQLIFSRQFSFLQNLKIEQTLQEKIQQLFYSSNH